MIDLFKGNFRVILIEISGMITSEDCFEHP